MTSGVIGAISVIIKGYVRGLLHAVNIFGAIKVLSSSKEIFLETLKCVGANLLLIVGSDALLHSQIIPLIRKCGLWIYEIDDVSLLPVWVETIASGIYYSAWLFPIWILIYLAVNIPAYAELASLSFSFHKQNLSSSSSSSSSSSASSSVDKKDTNAKARSSTVEEEIYRFIFFFFLILQKYFLRSLPDIGVSYFTLGSLGRSISFVFSMIICSLSAFEYMWHQLGVSTRSFSLSLSLSLLMKWKKILINISPSSFFSTVHPDPH
jgi:hypothetical protein